MKSHSDKTSLKPFVKPFLDNDECYIRVTAALAECKDPNSINNHKLKNALFRGGNNSQWLKYNQETAFALALRYDAITAAAFKAILDDPRVNIGKREEIKYYWCYGMPDERYGFTEYEYFCGKQQLLFTHPKIPEFWINIPDDNGENPVVRASKEDYRMFVGLALKFAKNLQIPDSEINIVFEYIKRKTVNGNDPDLLEVWEDYCYRNSITDL